jgi:hypothetical protein
VKTRIFGIVAAALAAGAVTAGCTSSSTGDGSAQQRAAAAMPAAESFAPGACRNAAEHVIALGEISGRLQGRTDVPAADRTALDQHQKALRAMLPQVADSSVRTPLQTLVTTVGWTRLRLDLQSYDPALLDAVAKADAATRAVCVR